MKPVYLGTKVMLREKDPWHSIPKDKRLDFKVIGENLGSLAEATINKLEREWPARISRIEGAQVLYRLLTIVAVTTYETITYLCADKREDPFRKIYFVSSSPPLLRSLLDGIYTVVFLGENLENRVPWYYKAGWREMAERDRIYRERYQGDAAWREWLESHQQFLETTRVDWRITETEAAGPEKMERWPTPGQMTRRRDLSPESKRFFEYLEGWFYRELSQATHLTYPGLSYRGGTFLRKKDDPLRDSEWFKKRSDGVGYAVVLLLAFLTETNCLLRFGLGQRCAYLWGILAQFFGVAEELFQERYKLLLENCQ